MNIPLLTVATKKSNGVTCITKCFCWQVAQKLHWLPGSFRHLEGERHGACIYSITTFWSTIISRSLKYFRVCILFYFVQLVRNSVQYLSWKIYFSENINPEQQLIYQNCLLRICWSLLESGFFISRYVS